MIYHASQIACRIDLCWSSNVLNLHQLLSTLIYYNFELLNSNYVRIRSLFTTFQEALPSMNL